jgi:hypothetical protein
MGRAQLLERADERGKVARRLDCVDLLDRHRLTLDPGVDLPEPGVVARRVALRDRDGDRDREERSERGQPLEQLPAGLRRASSTCEPNGEVVPEPKDRIVGPFGFDPLKRPLDPIG